MKRNTWEPAVKVFAESMPDHRFQKIVAELGELIYREVCSCASQLQTEQNANSIATRSVDGVVTERTDANGHL